MPKGENFGKALYVEKTGFQVALRGYVLPILGPRIIIEEILTQVRRDKSVQKVLKKTAVPSIFSFTKAKSISLATEQALQQSDGQLKRNVEPFALNAAYQKVETSIIQVQSNELREESFESATNATMMAEQEIKQEVGLEDQMQCHLCLSIGRHLVVLGKYADIYRILTTNLECFDTHLSAEPVVCWECRARLRRAALFRRTVAEAYQALRSGQNYFYSTLSSLTSVILSGTEGNTRYIDNDDMQTEINKYEMTNEFDNADFCTEDCNDITLNEDTLTNSNINTKTVYFDTKNVEDVKSSTDNSNAKEIILNKLTKQNRWARKRALQNKKPKFKILTNKEEIFRVEKMDTATLEKYLQKRRCSESFISKRFKCETCIKTFKNKKSLIKHYRDRHEMSPGSFVCEICSSVFKHKRHLSAHVSRHYNKYTCAVCGYSTSSLVMRDRHADTHGKVFRCVQCGLVFGSRRDFYKHFKEWHERFTCHHCGVTFKMRYCIEEHLRKQHSPFKCVPCDRQFTRYNGLWLHNKTHHAPSVQQAYCVECDKHYPDVYRYRWHLANSARHKPRKKTKIPCPGCDKVFSKNIYMRDHYDLVHLQCYKYRCEQCNKNFIRNADLVKHRRRVHEGILPPKNKICCMCARGFTTNKILANHMRTHTGERPFACALCPARFAQSAALAGHSRALHAA